jgi:uncharacterized DUF497 family protein
MKRIFRWHEAKAKSNFEKHKITFQKATEAFDDPFLVFKKDGREDGEERWRIIGASYDRNFLMFVVYTMRVEGEKEITWLISARRVTKPERKEYEHGRVRAR